MHLDLLPKFPTLTQQLDATLTPDKKHFDPAALTALHLTPDKIMDIMSNIEYGYVSNGKPKHDIEPTEFYKTYRLRSAADIWKDRLGVCWCQVELQRELFAYTDIVFKTIYFELCPGDSHTLLVFKTTQGWWWFEHSWGSERGIHGPFSTITDIVKLCIKTQITKLWDGINVFTRWANTYEKPQTGISCQEFMDFACDNNPIPSIQLDDVMFRSGPQGIKVFYPRRLTTVPSSKLKRKSVVMFTPEICYAAAFAFDFSDREGFILDKYNHDKFWTLTIPKQHKRRLDTPCSIYLIKPRKESEVTYSGEENGVPEYFSEHPCDVVREIKFATARECFSAYNVKIKIV